MQTPTSENDRPNNVNNGQIKDLAHARFFFGGGVSSTLTCDKLIPFFIRAKRVSNRYMQEKKN